MFSVEMSPILTLLVQIAVILTLSRVMGLLMRWMGQPQVVGEMIAGITLGPSVLGMYHGGAWMETLFPAASLGNLGLLSQLGVMLFMFLVGLELDPKLLKGQGKAALVTGTVGIIVPMVTGAVLALGLLQFEHGITQTGKSAHALVLCLFMGAAMSITAFPVLARILTERNLHKTKSGHWALVMRGDGRCDGLEPARVCAGDCPHGGGRDVTGEAAHAERDHGVRIGGHDHPARRRIHRRLMIFVVRRLLTHLQAHYESRGYLSQDVLAIVFLLLIASSVATEAIGIHQIFGAFLLGAVMPKDGHFYPASFGKSGGLRRFSSSCRCSSPTRGQNNRAGPPEFEIPLGNCGADHRRGDSWQVRKRLARRALVCHLLEAKQPARHPDEHARPDGTHHPQHRPDVSCPLAGSLRDDGGDDAGHDLHDHAADGDRLFPGTPAERARGGRERRCRKGARRTRRRARQLALHSGQPRENGVDAGSPARSWPDLRVAPRSASEEMELRGAEHSAGDRTACSRIARRTRRRGASRRCRAMPSASSKPQHRPRYCGGGHKPPMPPAGS